MEKFLALCAVLIALSTSTFAQGPVLTPIGTVSDSWRYEVSLTQFPGFNGVLQYSHLYEYCYQNPNQTDSTWIKTNFITVGINGISGCAASYIWYYGIQPGAKIWFYEYRVPHPYQAGSYFYTQYELVKSDRVNWHRSNVLTVPEVPGCPISTFVGKGKGKGRGK